MQVVLWRTLCVNGSIRWTLEMQTVTYADVCSEQKCTHTRKLTQHNQCMVHLLRVIACHKKRQYDLWSSIS